MIDDKNSQPFEYPDTAGYPDGKGFLDEGTAETAAGSAGSQASGEIEQQIE